MSAACPAFLFRVQNVMQKWSQCYGVSVVACIMAIACANTSQAASPQCPITPSGFPHDASHQNGLISLCAGLHGVKVGVPSNCQQYVVCCSGVPLTYTCHAPPKYNSTSLYDVSDLLGCV